MHQDFHYYATYCAGILAGYTHKESLTIGYSATLVDFFTEAMLTRIKGPQAAATSQLQLEMLDAGADILSLQNITRIWASFHFLPGDLYAKKPHCGRSYLSRYRLICNPNGELLASTVRLARDRSLQAAGLAMHVLADTWAHRYFAGTPSLVINNMPDQFIEIVPEGDGFIERMVQLKHVPGKEENPQTGYYSGTVYQPYETSIMNLGHARAGHLPDYSWARYKYLPAWGEYREILKDNPSDYMHAFRQMVYALRYLRGDYEDFETDRYDTERVDPYKERVEAIITKRQVNAGLDWKAFGEELSGTWIPAFDLEEYQDEYIQAAEAEKDGTFLGKFILAALAQKSMVTGNIFRSKNLLAGFSLSFSLKGVRRNPGFSQVDQCTESGDGKTDPSGKE